MALLRTVTEGPTFMGRSLPGRILATPVQWSSLFGCRAQRWLCVMLEARGKVVALWPKDSICLVILVLALADCPGLMTLLQILCQSLDGVGCLLPSRLQAFRLSLR